MWEEILEEFRAGTPFDEIRKKYRSQSQIYLALRIHSEEIEETYRETHMKLANSKTELADVEEQLELTKQERTEVSEEVQSLNMEKETGTQELISRREDLNKLNTEIEKLRALGFTTEIIQEIGTIEGRSGRKLLKQIKTVEKFYQTKKEFSNLRRKNGTLEKETQALQMKKTEIEKILISKKNELDQMELETITFGEALDAVLDMFEDGYSTENIVSLRQGLRQLGIQDDPPGSVIRLVQGLKREKTLVELEKQLIEKRKELEVLENRLPEVKAELKVAKEIVLKAIEDVKNVGLQAIDATTEQTKAMMLDTARRFAAAMNEQLGRCENHIQRNMEKVESGLKEYAEFQKEKARFEENPIPHHAPARKQNAPTP